MGCQAAEAEGWRQAPADQPGPVGGCAQRARVGAGGLTSLLPPPPGSQLWTPPPSEAPERLWVTLQPLPPPTPAGTGFKCGAAPLTLLSKPVMVWGEDSEPRNNPVTQHWVGLVSECPGDHLIPKVSPCPQRSGSACAPDGDTVYPCCPLWSPASIPARLAVLTAQDSGVLLNLRTHIPLPLPGPFGWRPGLGQ